MPGQRANNLQILAEGTLYIAKWTPEGRRRFAAITGDAADRATQRHRRAGSWSTTTSSPTPRRGSRARLGATEFTDHYATNRPEDVEVDADGTVFIAFTNNSAPVNDAPRLGPPHGRGRRRPRGDHVHLGGLRRRRPDGPAVPGEKGFSSRDNLDVRRRRQPLGRHRHLVGAQGSTLPAAHYAYHGNNAVFMIPRTGPNAGVAFRFANMPVESEGTGPYFTPDEQTLFVAVQHPGEESKNSDSPSAAARDLDSSYWPYGLQTTGRTDRRAAAVARADHARAARHAGPGSPVIPPPPGDTPTTPPRPDATKPRITLVRPGERA